MDIAERGAVAVAELFHYGVKGMKWGVRKDKKGSKGPVDVTVTQKRPGGGLQAKGGQRQPATEEAKKAVAARQKARMSGTKSLSNEELQEAVTRMNLEQQFNKLSANQKSAGAKFVENLFVNAGKQQAQQIVNQEVGRQVGAYMGKRATRG